MNLTLTEIKTVRAKEGGRGEGKRGKTGRISTRVDEGGRKSVREKSCYFRSFGIPYVHCERSNVD